MNFLGRVTDKSCLYTCMLLKEALQRVKDVFGLHGSKNLVLISDSGPHFRSMQLLSFASTELMWFMRQSNGSMWIRGQLGAPGHI